MFQITSFRNKIVCNIAFYGKKKNMFFRLTCLMLVTKCVIFRLYFNYTPRSRFIALTIRQCLPIFGKYVFISKLPKTCYDSTVNSSGDFYLSLLKGHHSMFWYLGSKQLLDLLFYYSVRTEHEMDLLH